MIDDDFVIECLVQDVFLKLWEYRDKIERPDHILFFLRFVMKRNCYSYYTKPKNRFSRKINSLEKYENYQNYMAGYDPADSVEALKEQDIEQNNYEKVLEILPLLSDERKNLINLCLKYGFQYKLIARAIGKGVKETSNEIKKAIDDIKLIINNGNKYQKVETKISPPLEKMRSLSNQQLLILNLRCQKNYSFAKIAIELQLSSKEVHKEFLYAYKFNKEKESQVLKNTNHASVNFKIN